jgi:hypothetical protein
LGALKMTVVREVIIPKWFRHHLLTCTKRCGRMDYAERLFDRITSKNVVAWNAMIGGLKNMQVTFK